MRPGRSLPLLLSAVLLSCVPAFGPATAGAASSAAPHRPLRLLTYNLLHGGPASGFMQDDSRLDVRLQMAVSEIQSLDPDIIALQEVSQSRQYGDIPARLAERLGFQLAYAPATERLFRGTIVDRLIIGLIGFREGVAILSRFPIVQSQTHDLPRCRRWYDPRVLLEVAISTPEQRLRVFTTHPSRHADCQVPRIAELVIARRREGPSLLMGDLNAAETSVRKFFRNEAGFVDVFRTANPEVPGLTVYQQIRVERPTVFRRVDYIFLLAESASSVTVRSSRTVMDRPGRLADGVLWPSDHYGVFAEVEIRP